MRYWVAYLLVIASSVLCNRVAEHGPWYWELLMATTFSLSVLIAFALVEQHTTQKVVRFIRTGEKL